MKEIKALLEIIKSFLEKREYVLNGELDEQKLYQLAKKHRVSNFLIDWARKDCESQEIKCQIEEDFNYQIVKDTNEKVEFESLLQCFEKNHVKTLVIKGFIMKEVYPQGYMRQMCDMDILVQEENFKEAVKLMNELGYRKLEDSEHHIVYEKPPFGVVELHRKLTIRRSGGGRLF